jgi:hypothetical protein
MKSVVSFLRCIRPLFSLILFSLLLTFIPTFSATASTWQLAAQSEKGDLEQYVDVDSIQRSGSIVRLESYFLDKRQGTPIRMDYTTDYDCDKNQYQDLVLNGEAIADPWVSASPDPINQSVLDYACQFKPTAPD